MNLLPFFLNYSIFFLSALGIALSTRSILSTIVSIELMLLSVNLNFLMSSSYLGDMYGQIFSLFILTVAAAESAVGLAVVILYYRVRGSISLNQKPAIKG
jgi:NADH-quinone oxidoreductase subunit K